MAYPSASDLQLRAHSCADLSIESELWRAGYRDVAGADEVGRGAWAGPMFAAAVIFPADPKALAPLVGRVNDSKKCTPLAREHLCELVYTHARAVGIGSATAEEIDQQGIVSANRLALFRAVGALVFPPDFVLLDFLTLPGFPVPQRGIPHGDGLSLTIAAASIVAKVTRDRWMVEQEAYYPGYGFARHKGYGTAEHRAALGRLRLCALHRRSFAPVGALAQSSEGEALR